MPTLVMINGVLCRPEDAKLSVFDRGLLYGDSVFEAVGTYQGRPFALVQHLERLRRSAALVHIEVPIDDEAFRKEIEAVIAAAGFAESYVRVIVTRGSGEMGLDPGLAVSPQRIAIVTELHRPPELAYDQGVSAITYKTQRTTDDTEAAGAKVGNYLVAVLAMQEAKRVGANEALIVDRLGQVVEGATSNVFVVKAGRLVTPPESAGILLGITRAVIIDVAERVGVPVSYGCPLVKDLLDADEVFITSSIRQLLALAEVDGHAIGNRRPGPVYCLLLETFHKTIQEQMKLHLPMT